MESESRSLLYSNGSPYARRVRVILLELGLEFQADVNDSVREIADIEAHNPALQVPVFYDNGRHLFGSNLIIEYLYHTYPDRLHGYAQPPLAPTITRADSHWEDKLVLTAIESLADSLVNVRLMTAQADIEAPFMTRQRYRIGSCLTWLEQRITSEGFWPTTFSIMDLNLMCPLLYGEKRETFDFRTGQWPKITRMIDRWQSRPSIMATPVNDFPIRRRA